jgi:hypothetical protein
MEIKTDGEYRVTGKSDGLYVVGYGMCITVDDAEEDEELLENLKSK